MGQAARNGGGGDELARAHADGGGEGEEAQRLAVLGKAAAEDGE